MVAIVTVLTLYKGQGLAILAVVMGKRARVKMS